MLYLIVVLLCVLASTVPSRDIAPFAKLQRFAFDYQMKLLREFYPRPAAVEPVLIGVDESTVAAFAEPHALWHFHLAQTLEALAHARPAAVGMDIVLPERSYENLLPGGQIALIRSLVLLKQHTNVSFVRTMVGGKLAPVHPSYSRMLSEEDFGSDQAIHDPDLVARRFNELELDKNNAVRPMAGRIASGLGKPVGEGYIDYSRGDRVGYIPMQQVIGWLQDKNDSELKRRFDGKVVLIGFLLNDLDKWKLPVWLANWDHPKGDVELEQPGVLVHLQTLRSLLGAGLITPLPRWLAWLLVLPLAAIVWMESSPRLFVFGGVLAPIGLIGLSLLTLQVNFLLPVALWIGTLLVALVVRAIADGLDTAVEKKRLKQSFSGSVSPAVLREIMAGNLASGASGHSMNVCVLFSDIRGFTTLSEMLPAEMVTNVLTRYFDKMVAAVHRHNGTLDKFIGDGMMVFFGAPQPLANPCGNAVSCAQDMVVALQELNAEFENEQLPTIRIGIGINYGSAVVGNIGSSERHNYSAIGDVVNVASRVEGLTKRIGCQVLITEPVKLQLGKLDENFELLAHGEQAVQGHSPVQVWSLEPRIKAGSN